MADSVATRVRFGPFTFDVRSNELHKGPTRLKVPDQSIEILKALLERPGELVTREELRQRLWPADTFVDFEHGLNAAVRRVRDALGDSADAPTFIETLPRRGYRFVGSVELPHEPADGTGSSSQLTTETPTGHRRRTGSRTALLLALFGVSTAAAALGLRSCRSPDVAAPSAFMALTRVTFEPGLQMNPTISSDGHQIAYAADKSGNFDIWFQSTARDSKPVQVTSHPAHDWQPAFSPDGGEIVFRSERDGGGLFRIPSSGGHETKISDVGYEPRWSADGSRLLFSELALAGAGRGTVYTMRLDGAPKPVDTSALAPLERRNPAIGWHPDSRRVTFVNVLGMARIPQHWTPHVVTIDVETGQATRSTFDPRVQRAFDEQQVSAVDSLIWAPDGGTIYFTGVSQGLRNVWRIRLHPSTLAITDGPVRLTTMPDQNEGLALSRDGNRLVFGVANRNARVGLYRLDPTGRQIAGVPRFATGLEVHAVPQDLTSDGSKLLTRVQRRGRELLQTELMEQSLSRQSPDRRLLMDGTTPGEQRFAPRWSPDGLEIVFRHNPAVEDRGEATKLLRSLKVLNTKTLQEKQLTTAITTLSGDTAYGWSPDGQFVVGSTDRYKTGVSSVVLFRRSEAPAAERQAQVVTQSGDFVISNTTMSPDNEWICFSAIPRRTTGSGPSRIAIVKASGGTVAEWIWMTDTESWNDKPRWSDDGRLVYFISRKGGPLNVWAAEFDPSAGRQVGMPFQLTRFNGAGAHILPNVGIAELAVARGLLAIPVMNPIGGIWMLEHPGR